MRSVQLLDAHKGKVSSLLATLTRDTPIRNASISHQLAVVEGHSPARALWPLLRLGSIGDVRYEVGLMQALRTWPTSCPRGARLALPW